MIRKVEIKSADQCCPGYYDIFFDGEQVADKISSMTIFFEAGRPPHMLVSAYCEKIDIDGMDMNVSMVEQQPAEESEGECEHESVP